MTGHYFIIPTMTMFKNLLLTLFSVCSLSLTAQIATTIELFEPVGDVVYNIALDVDNDGDLEVVCASSERLFWVERMEDGYFSRHNVISPIGLGYRSLVAADIDEDGDDDIVYASHDGGLGAHINLGDGEWSPAIEIYNPGVIIECYVADLNGDGHLDVMTGSSSEVRWLAGNGNGGFGSAQLVSDDHATTISLRAEDMDGDGDQDILLAAIIGDRLAWHENLGNGNFGDYHVINEMHDGPTEVTTADMDGDELPDIVCVNRQEDEDVGAGLVWYRNLGGGNFALVDTLMARGWHEYVHVEDMDADGDMDIISCHGNDEMDWLANDGNGNFGPPQELARNSTYLRFVETPDLNNDGFPDILYGLNDNAPERHTTLWRESTAAGEWKPFEAVVLGGENFSKPITADIDQDGLLDIVVGSDGSESLVWLRNEGFEFSTPRLIARRFAYSPNSIDVRDINNDGWPDVLAGSIQDDFTSTSDFCFYINNGDGTFTAGPPFETWYFTQRDMELVDVDNDGDLDMLWASPGTNSSLNNAALGWVRNDGSSWSEPIIILSEMTNLLDVLVTDFDTDGQLDLVLCKKDEPRLARIEHINNGNFTDPQEIFNDFTGGLYAQAADVNGDGLLDLIASNEGIGTETDQIAWWQNMGNGLFGGQQDIYESEIPLEKFVYADFDLDGHKDIIASTYSEYPMQLLKGEGNATFAPPIAIEGTNERVRNFVLEDIDSDGDWDIIGENEGNFFGETEDALFVAYNLANDKSISGLVFNDLNANGLQDEGESGVGRVSISVTPDALAVFADDDGEFAVYGRSGTYTISPELDECWTLSTTPEAYEVTFDGSASIDSLLFGVTPNTQDPEAAVTLASAPTRCGFTVPFWLNYRNDGCWAFDGEVYLVLSDLATYVSASIEPSSQSADTLFWNFNGLAPGTSRSIELMMTIAGVEFIGSTLAITSGVIPYDDVGIELPAETFDFYSTINCAYDPNDKQVYPNRSEQPPFTANYTLFDEALLYTLRFQNTGTDTAFNIVLRDQLSEQLDWSSFRPGSSSHPYEATLHDDGLLEFHFRDILLPDSTTNEPGSHGFVQFEIAAHPDLEEGTSIENTAGIYFDFNPPIITNTVNSMMVTELPNFTPVAAFTFMNNALEVNFTDASSNDPDNWLWDFGDGTTSTLQNPIHTYSEDGTYTVCLTAVNDWGETEYCEELTVSLTRVSSIDEYQQIQLQPNPANSIVWVDFKQLSLPQKLTLYSVTGKEIQTVLLEEQLAAWDISHLPAGSYWIRTEAGTLLPLVVVK